MTESFEITVAYKNKILSFSAKLLRYGYTHRIIVSVDNANIVFEPDEERNYRAFADPSDTVNSPLTVDAGLLGAIAQTLESIVK